MTTRRDLLKAGAVSAAALATGALTAESAFAAPSNRDDLQDALDLIVAAGASAAVAEVRDATGTWRGASGVAELDSARPTLAHGRFRIASVTKTFVATVVLQLVGERRIRLDDRIERWLPGIVPNSHAITIRQLLQHTSGVYDYLQKLLQLFPGREDRIRNRHRSFTPQELVALVAPEPPLFPPGTGWSYSNTNYILLGMLIERITGCGYGAEIRRRIVRPMRLPHTAIPGTDPSIPGPHAHVYLPVLRDGQVVPVDITTWNPSWAGASGEIISTTSDVNRFFRALLGGRLLAPSQLDDMLGSPAGPSHYGLGIEKLVLPCGTELWGHSGGFPGYDMWALTTEDASRQLALSVNPLRMPGGGDPVAAQRAFIQAALCR